MSAASQSLISASCCAFPSNGFLGNARRRATTRVMFSAAAPPPNTEESDCNDEECAPDKEVGKISMEWLAAEKTKVLGTYPPRTRGWTGYVEKDTAGQTNIYSVEPVVYIAESAISSGSAGTSSEGSQNTIAAAAGLALVSMAAASVILLQVGKSGPQIPTMEYTGPPLSYYVNKFKPVSIVEASVPTERQGNPSASIVEASGSAETQSNPSLVQPENLDSESQNQLEAPQVQVD